MNRGYKYRIYPKKDQKIIIEKTFGCSRFIYNHLLEDRENYYKENKKTLKKEVTYYKNNPEYFFLKEVDSLALANAKKNLDTAYKKFFKHEAGHPKFHKKGIHNSYTTNMVNNNIVIENNGIKLPKLGVLKIKQHRLTKEGEVIKNVTISREGNKYYVSICVESDEKFQQMPKENITLDKTIGLDYSSPLFYVDSNGNSPQFGHYYRKYEKQLAIAQRKLSRMVKHSNNYKKQVKKINKIHAKIKNQRLDFLHKLSNQITNDYDLICFEDINLKNISQCLSLGKATMDNGFGMFRSMVAYKALWKGKYSIKVDKFYPSTKTCNNCGYVNKNIQLNTREWICPNCGKLNHRDENAALNIKEEGYRLLFTQ